MRVKKSYFASGGYRPISEVGPSGRRMVRAGGQMKRSLKEARKASRDAHLDDIDNKLMSREPYLMGNKGANGAVVRRGSKSSGKSTTYLKPGASKETELHEAAHAEPSRSGYRLSNQISSSPRKRGREEGRADYLARGYYKQGEAKSAYANRARAARKNRQENDPFTSGYMEVQDQMKSAGARVRKSLVGHPLAGRKVFTPIKEFAEQERQAEKNPMLRSMNAAFGDTGLRLARRKGAYAAAKQKDPVSASFKGKTREEWRAHQIARDPFSAANKRRHTLEPPTPLTERERAEAVLFVGTQGRKGSLPTHAIRKSDMARVKKSFIGGRYVKATALGRGDRELLRRGGQMASQKAITRMENHDVKTTMNGVYDAIKQGSRMRTKEDFDAQGIGGFAVRTGGPSSGKSHLFLPPDASRNTQIHEASHGEPRRSMYRMHHQITSDPSKRLREEARADYLAGGHFMDAAKLKETKTGFRGKERVVERRNPDQSGYGDSAYRLRREEQSGKKGAFDDLAHGQIGAYARNDTDLGVMLGLGASRENIEAGRKATRDYQNLHGKMKAAGTKVRKSMSDKKAWHSIDQSERLASQNRRKKNNAAKNAFGVATLATTGAAVFPKDTVDAWSQTKLLGRLARENKGYTKIPAGLGRIARSNPVGTAVLAGGVGAAGLGGKAVYHGVQAKEHQNRADRRRKANYDRKRRSVSKALKNSSFARNVAGVGEEWAGNAWKVKTSYAGRKPNATKLKSGILNESVTRTETPGRQKFVRTTTRGRKANPFYVPKRETSTKETELGENYKMTQDGFGGPTRTRGSMTRLGYATSGAAVGGAGVAGGYQAGKHKVSKSDIEMVRNAEGKFMGRRYVAPAMLDTAIAFDNEDLVEKGAGSLLRGGAAADVAALAGGAAVTGVLAHRTAKGRKNAGNPKLTPKWNGQIQKSSSAELREQRDKEQSKGNRLYGAGSLGGIGAMMIPYSRSANRLVGGIQADHKSMKYFAANGDYKGARKAAGYVRGAGRSLKYRVPRSPVGAALFAGGTASIPLAVAGGKHINEAQKLNGQAVKQRKLERKAEVAKYSFGPNPTHLKPGVVSSVTRRVDSGKRRVAETVDTIGRKDNPFYTPKRTTTTRRETFPEGRPGTKKYQPRTVTSSTTTSGRRIKPLGGAVIGAGGVGAGASGGYAAGKRRNDVTKAFGQPQPPKQPGQLSKPQQAGIGVGAAGLGGGMGLGIAARGKQMMGASTGGGQGAKMFRQAGKLQKLSNKSAVAGFGALGATAGLTALRNRQQGVNKGMPALPDVHIEGTLQPLGKIKRSRKGLIAAGAGALAAGGGTAYGMHKKKG